MPHPGVIMLTGVAVLVGAILGAAYYAFADEEEDYHHRRRANAHRVIVNNSNVSSNWPTNSIWHGSNLSLRYSRPHSMDENEIPLCVICRDDLANNWATKKLSCSHVFHSKCIELWFEQSKTCPSCRKTVNVYN